MERYVKKPIVVEAERWFEVTYDREAGHGHSLEHGAIYHLNVGYYRRPDVSGTRLCKHCGRIMNDHGWMDTLEGEHTVCPGDWIIRGTEGEMYPCKDIVFRTVYNKYDPADDITTGCYDELEDLEFEQRNPAHYCFGCDKYLGYRGFCSDKCHDDHYDAELEEINGQFETLEILNDDDCMAGIRKSMEQINNGEGIPLSELYPKKPLCFGMGIEVVESYKDGEWKIIDKAKIIATSVPFGRPKICHKYEDNVIAKDSLSGKYG